MFSIDFVIVFFQSERNILFCCIIWKNYLTVLELLSTNQLIVTRMDRGVDIQRKYPFLVPAAVFRSRVNVFLIDFLLVFILFYRDFNPDSNKEIDTVQIILIAI